MDRPSFISEIDYKELQNKYKNLSKLKKVVNKISNDYPIQYAIGNVPFINTTIFVNKNVLIPRFETELLVSKLINYIKKCNLEDSNILDLCTGSGCIATCLKKNLSNSKVYGVDKSFKALHMAKKNAKYNGVNVGFMRKDALNNYKYNTKFSVLVSNPPYVKLNEYVSPNTKYEPSMALYPGSDDIIFYKKILDNSKKILTDKSIIAFEIGSTQADSIVSYAKSIYKDSEIVIEKDYNDFDRYIFIFNKCE